MENSKLERINALAHLSKERPLTPEEKEEQAALRKAYIAEWRQGAMQVLDNTYLVDEKGNRRPLRRKDGGK